jgi:hypothetical protein
MANNLSHSSVSKFLQCGEAYRLHYQERLRSQVMGASLPFGTAMDAAINALLTSSGNPEETFTKEFSSSFVNGKRVTLQDYEHLVYADADMDAELLTDEDRASFNADEYEALRKLKKEVGYKGMAPAQKVAYNKVNWLSLRRKGLLMIDAYRRKIVPRITKIHAVQHKINLTNEAGDTVVGYVDLICDIDGKTVVIDNKTSAQDYSEEDLLTSAQLSLYTHAIGEQYNTRYAGYIVMKKNIMKNRSKVCQSCGHDGSDSKAKTCDNIVNSKRCFGTWTETIKPDAHIQVLIDEIPIKTEELIMNNIDEVNRAISAGHFTKNLSSCLNTYGSPCPYFSLCYKGKKDGLVKV